MKRLLDTNVLIHAQRGKPVHVRRRLQEESPDNIVLTAITIAELWYGALRSTDAEAKRALWTHVIAPYEVLPFDRAAAEQHALVRSEVRHSPIGERDLLIAAIALANDLVVVTGNAAEFRRVPGLRVEDWTEPLR